MKTVSDVVLGKEHWIKSPLQPEDSQLGVVGTPLFLALRRQRNKDHCELGLGLGLGGQPGAIEWDTV